MKFQKMCLSLLLTCNLVTLMEQPKGLLSIPSIDVKEAVYFAPLVDHQWNPDDWENRVANLGGTAWMVDDRGMPVDQFTIVLVSHTNGPLKDIPLLEYGDDIYLYNGVWEMRYVVDVIDSKVHYRDLWPVMPTDYPTLTLMICQGEDYRYIVRASRVEVINQWTGENYYGS